MVFSSWRWTLRWLRGLICQLPPNNKANYLVRTICRILDFLHL
jgi:hypothetical protein